jgi:hypothetical protein
MAAPVNDLVGILDAWRSHPKFANRALGGVRALDGFFYQFAVSLDQFFEAVLKGDPSASQCAFEALSDFSAQKHDLTYLVQIKTTLSMSALRHALAEALAIDQFLAEGDAVMR